MRKRRSACAPSSRCLRSIVRCRGHWRKSNGRAGISRAGRRRRAGSAGWAVYTEFAAAPAVEHSDTGAIGIKGRITRGTHGHSRSGQLGAEPDHASRGVCARTDAHQTSRAAERTSLLRMLRGADGVLVFGEEGAQVHVLCMAQCRGRTVCPAKSLPARSIEDSVLSRIWEAGPLRNRRMGTTGTCQAGRGGTHDGRARRLRRHYPADNDPVPRGSGAGRRGGSVSSSEEIRYEFDFGSSKPGPIRKNFHQPEFPAWRSVWLCRFADRAADGARASV